MTKHTTTAAPTDDTTTVVEPSGSVRRRVDEASAVVELEADDLLAHQAAVTMRPAGIGHFDAQTLEQAAAELDRYLPSGKLPGLVVTVDQMAQGVLASSRLAITAHRARLIAGGKLMARCTDKVLGQHAYRIGRPVTLTTAPSDEPDNDAPVLFYVETEPGSKVAQAGHAAAIVLMVPTKMHTWTDERGEQVTTPSHFDPAAFLGIVRYFPTVGDAADDLERLSDAVRTLRALAKSQRMEADHEADPFQTVASDVFGDYDPF